jgi:Golgi phosphoprotein 3 (GPP34)
MLIAEAVMLVLIDPPTGRPKVDIIRLDTVLGGALTCDLEVRGLLHPSPTGPLGNLRVTAARTPDGRLAELPDTLRGDSLMIDGLRIAAARSYNGPRLVGKLGRNVLTTTTQRFVDRGIVEARPEKRWLGLVTLSRWPVLDPAPVEAQNRRVYDVIVGGRAPDAHTRALLTMLHAIDVTHRVIPLDGLTRSEVRARVAPVVGKSWIATAVRALVAAQMPG